MNIILPFATILILIAIIIFLIYSRAKSLVALKDALKKLAESEKRYQGVLDSLQDVYYRTDMNGIITRISPSIENYVGLTSDEIIGRNASEFYVNPLDRLPLLEKLSKTGSVTDYRITLKGKNGEPIRTSLASHLVYDENKKPVAVEGILHELK